MEGAVDSQYGTGDSEWDDFGDRGYDVGINFKTTNGWYSNGDGTDKYGFSALPGGFRGVDGSGFGSPGRYGW